jgi:hypothetical protein
MIYYTRSAEILDGKNAAAMEFAVKVASYVNDNYPGLNVRVLSNVSGQVNQVHWVSGYESLAALEETSAKIGADSGYQEIVATAEGLFAASTHVTHLYRTVP